MSQTDKKKVLAKYLNPLKKKNNQSYSSNLLMRDEEIVNEIQSSESEDEESERIMRINSQDEDEGVEKRKKIKQKKKMDKTEKKVRKLLRKKLNISKDEDIDDFIENLQIEGVSFGEIKEHLKKNKQIKFEAEEGNKKDKKAKKQAKYSMFDNDESSDLEIPQQARTIYRKKDGTIRGHSQKVAKQKHRQEVEGRLAEWEKGMKKAESESDQNDQDYRLAKNRNIWDDPMKRWEKDNLKKPLVCRFDGAPNRYNIKPGFRWDGVIRGNGFENKYLQEQNLKKVQKEQSDLEYLKNL